MSEEAPPYMGIGMTAGETAFNPINAAFKKEFESIWAQREEILRAFIAKYGADPDRVHLVEILDAPMGLRRWHVELLDLWLPMRTAPKDGSMIDLYVNGRRRPDCFWFKERWNQKFADSRVGSFGIYDDALGWMYPPLPPKAAFERKIDIGDEVHHQKSGENWVVARVTEAHVFPCGWPCTIVPIEECFLTRKATLEQRASLVADLGGLPSNDPRHIPRFEG